MNPTFFVIANVPIENIKCKELRNYSKQYDGMFWANSRAAILNFVNVGPSICETQTKN